MTPVDVEGIGGGQQRGFARRWSAAASTGRSRQPRGVCAVVRRRGVEPQIDEDNFYGWPIVEDHRPSESTFSRARISLVG